MSFNITDYTHFWDTPNAEKPDSTVLPTKDLTAQKEAVDQILPGFTYDDRGNLNLVFDVTAENAPKIKNWLIQIDERLFVHRGADKKTGKLFWDTLKRSDLEWSRPLKESFIWHFKDSDISFRGTFSLKRLSGTQHQIIIYLNLLRFDPHAIGGGRTKLPDPGELILIQKAFACHLLGFEFSELLPLFLQNVETEPKPGYTGDDGSRQRLEALTRGEGILQKKDYLKSYLEKTYPLGATLNDILVAAEKLALRPIALLEAYLGTFAPTNEDQTLASWLLGNCEKLKTSLKLLVTYYVDPEMAVVIGLYENTTPSFDDLVSVTHQDSNLLRRLLSFYFKVPFQNPDFNQLKKLAEKLEVNPERLTSSYFEQPIAGIINNHLDQRPTLQTLEALSQDDDHLKSALIQFYYGEECLQFILRLKTNWPNREQLNSFSEENKIKLIYAFFGKEGLRLGLHSAQTLLTREKLNEMAGQSKLALEALETFFYGHLPKLNNPSKTQINKLVRETGYSPETLLAYYYDQSFADIVKQLPEQPTHNDLKFEWDPTLLNKLVAFYYENQIHLLEPPNKKPTLQEMREDTLSPIYTQCRFFYGETFLPLLKTTDVVSPFYTIASLAKTLKMDASKIWTFFYGDLPYLENPTFRNIYHFSRGNGAEILKQVEFYYGPTFQKWISTFKISQIKQDKISVKQVLDQIPLLKPLDAEKILNFFFGSTLMDRLNSSVYFFQAITLMGGENPSYSFLQRMAHQTGKSLDHLIRYFYGTPTLGGWVEALRERLGTEKVMTRQELGKLIYQKTGKKITVKDLEELEKHTAASPYPSEEQIKILAQVAQIDGMLLYYFINREKLPLVDASLTRDSDGEFYPGENWGDFCGKILENIYKQPEGHPFWNKDEGLTSRSVFFNFIKLYNPPKKEKIKNISTVTGLPVELIYAFIIDRKYPALRELLKKMGLPQFQFYVDPEHDPDKIIYYSKNPNKLGFRLWLSRKEAGLTMRELTNRASIDRRLYYPLELDQDLGVSATTLGSLHEVLGLPLGELRKLADITYPSKPAETTQGIVGHADPQSVRYLFLTAIGKRKYEEVFKEATSIFEAMTGVTHTVNTRAMDSFFDLPVERRAPPLEAVLMPETDLNIVAFLMAFGSKINPAQFIARARSELRFIFPDFSEASPVFKVSGDTNIQSILKISVPLILTRMRLDGGLDRVNIARSLGVEGNPMLITLRESMDYPISTVGWYLNEAKLYNVDPRLLYLSRNPWLLLFVPLVDEESGKSIKFPFGAKKLAKILGDYWQNQLIDGRFLVKDILKEEGIYTEEDLVKKGGSKELAKKLFVSHMRIKLFGDELLEVVKLFPNINKRALLEGFKKGELLYVLGQNPDGSIYYQPETSWAAVKRLDLKQIATQIYEKLKDGEQTYRQFWQAQKRFKPTLDAPSFALHRGEVNVELMMEFVQLAIKAGINNLSLKTLYLHHSMDFLKQFNVLPAEDTFAQVDDSEIKSDSSDRELQPDQSLEVSEDAGTNFNPVVGAQTFLSGTLSELPASMVFRR